jgi:hypothetical protein
MVMGLCSREEALIGNMGLQLPSQRVQVDIGVPYEHTMLLNADLSDYSLGQEKISGVSCLTTA